MGGQLVPMREHRAPWKQRTDEPLAPSKFLTWSAASVCQSRLKTACQKFLSFLSVVVSSGALDLFDLFGCKESSGIYRHPVM